MFLCIPQLHLFLFKLHTLFLVFLSFLFVACSTVSVLLMFFLFPSIHSNHLCLSLFLIFIAPVFFLHFLYNSKNELPFSLPLFLYALFNFINLSALPNFISLSYFHFLNISAHCTFSHSTSKT